MTPLPKRKLSTRRQGHRRQVLQLELSALSKCPNCGNSYRPHTVCGNCGYYNGQQVVTPKVVKSKSEDKN